MEFMKKYRIQSDCKISISVIHTALARNSVEQIEDLRMKIA